MCKHKYDSIVYLTLYYKVRCTRFASKFKLLTGTQQVSSATLISMQGSIWADSSPP
jgi:hypothetical protein